MLRESSTLLRIAGVLVVCFSAACTSPEDVSSTDDALERGAWQPSLAEGTTGVLRGDRVSILGCTYTIGTAVEGRPAQLPPRHFAFVERSGHFHRCPTGYVVLGMSYGRPSVDIVAGHGELVTDFSFKSTPSGSAHTKLAIVSLPLAAGEARSRIELSAMPPDFMHPQLGNVYSGALAIYGDDLIVTGDKDGVIPGEVGSGRHYTAVYEGFFGSEEDPAPDSVVAF